MQEDYDPRLTAMRGDLAASHLRGRLEAPRYVGGVRFQATAPAIGVHREPTSDSEQMNQLLLGESAIIYDVRGGWGWGQSLHDDYVGWMSLIGLSSEIHEPSKRIRALRSIIYTEPDLRAPALMSAPMNARIALSRTGGEGGFLPVARGGWIVASHLADIDHRGGDHVAIAQRFLGTPYLWGGRCSMGIDCSGLVQAALGCVGQMCPRDTDMQFAALGRGLGNNERPARGDFAFWKGHVAILIDERLVIHADGRSMSVVIEPLSEVSIWRMPVTGDGPSFRRLVADD